MHQMQLFFVCAPIPQWRSPYSMIHLILGIQQWLLWLCSSCRCVFMLWMEGSYLGRPGQQWCKCLCYGSCLSHAWQQRQPSHHASKKEKHVAWDHCTLISGLKIRYLRQMNTVMDGGEWFWVTSILNNLLQLLTRPNSVWCYFQLWSCNRSKKLYFEWLFIQFLWICREHQKGYNRKSTHWFC